MALCLSHLYRSKHPTKKITILVFTKDIHTGIINFVYKDVFYFKKIVFHNLIIILKTTSFLGVAIKHTFLP